MYKYSHYTVDWGFHRNSTILLFSLLSFSPVCQSKTIITYGKNAEFDIPRGYKHFYVLNISRSGNEYKGIINKYFNVKEY
jgi:hypothetical protein